MLSPSRWFYLGAVFVVIASGLLSRSGWVALPRVLAGALGDILWASMVYLGLRFIVPAAPRWQSAIAALVCSFAVEVSQLFHPPWLDTLRATRLGHLVLGSTFYWPDLLAYTFGIAAAWGGDHLTTAGGARRNRSHPGGVE